MSSSKKLSTMEYVYTFIVPRVTNVGAAVVIIGAMFKILHLPNGGPILAAGLITEAFLFFIAAFAPLHAENHRPDWSLIYPQLNDEDYVPSDKPVLPGSGAPAVSQDPSVSKKLAEIDAALAKSLTGAKIESFGNGMKSLSENVTKMGKLSSASVATEEYAKNVKLASNAIVEMNKSYKTTINAMSEMSNASKDAKAYHAQVQGLTKNLTELNTFYEVEMREAKKHVKSVNDFYKGLGVAVENVSSAGKDAATLKTEMSALAGNLTSLNKVYGSMLAAMKG
ncbi:type IX secretion system motor protein PorL/GldL [Microscilla marina]|nr:gliding motility protein GldL [Microscilla marina]